MSFILSTNDNTTIGKRSEDVCETTTGQLADNNACELELWKLRLKYSQLEAKYSQLEATAQYDIEQAHGDRDFYMEQYAEQVEIVSQLEEQVEKLEEQNSELLNDKQYLFKRVDWYRNLFYSPDYAPTEKVVLFSGYDDVDLEDPNNLKKINIKAKAKRIGISPKTYGQTLIKLSNIGVINRHEHEIEGERGQKLTQVDISYPMQLLMDPSSIEIKKEEHRGGERVKGRVMCKSCGGYHIKVRDQYSCVGCGNSWTGEYKDVNKNILDEELPEHPVYDTTPEPVEETIIEEPEHIRESLNQESVDAPHDWEHETAKSFAKGQTKKINESKEMPEWLRPGTWAWKKQCARNGEKEMQERRRAWLENRE